MRHLFIGGAGLVGSAAVNLAQDYQLDWLALSRPLLDLSQPIDTDSLPEADIVYLIAAIRKPVECELNPAKSWRINADAPVKLAQHYNQNAAFVVFISSNAVETGGMMTYVRQKTFVESFMNTIYGAIIRPGHISNLAAQSFAAFMIKVGMNRRSGLYHWTGPLSP